MCVVLTNKSYNCDLNFKHSTKICFIWGWGAHIHFEKKYFANAKYTR